MTSVAGNLALVAEIALAALNAVQERDRDIHCDVGAAVVGLAPVTTESIESTKTAIAACFATEDIRKVAKKLVHIHISLLVARSVVLHTRVTKLIIPRTLVIVLQHLVRLAHFDELLLGILVPLFIKTSEHTHLVLVGMVLLCQFEICLLYVCL